MKLIHSADWHLGERQYGLRAREQDYYNAAGYIANRANELDANVVILAGDNFDVIKPSAEAVWRLKQIVSFLQDCGITVVGIDGNHDPSEGYWLKVCGVTPLNLTPIRVTNNRHGHNAEYLDIAGINACRPKVFLEQLKRLVAADQHIDILVIHQPLTDMVGFDCGLTADEITKMIQHTGIRYLAMGDIHMRKECMINGIWCVYPGSPEWTATNEMMDKSFSIIDMTVTELKLGIDLIPVRPRIIFKLEDETDLTKLAAMVKENNDALINVTYPSHMGNLAKRAEIMLSGTQTIYRIVPEVVARLDADKNLIFTRLLNDTGHGRRGTVDVLKPAVDAFFQPDTDEAQLIQQMLSTPSEIVALAERYVKLQLEKGTNDNQEKPTQS